MSTLTSKILQSLTVLLGIAVLFFLIRFPQTEGRAQGLDLYHIYADPLILYVYASSVLFFIGLYHIYKIIGYYGQNKQGTPASIKSLRRIRYCALALSLLIILSGVYIRFFHAKEDDPAGFIAASLFLTVISLSVAVVSWRLEKKAKKN